MRRFALSSLAAPLLLDMVAIGLFVRLSAQPLFGFSTEGGTVRIQDFSGVWHFAASWWGGGSVSQAMPSPYTVAAHLAMMREWIGTPVEQALPFVYPPTMLVLFAPFCLVPVNWAFLAWSLLGASTTGWVVRHGGHWVPVSLALVSPVGFAVLALGQSAFLTTSALLVLMRWEPGRPRWGAVLALVLLTIKPPLALMAGLTLLACGRQRLVGEAVALSLGLSALLTQWLGANWVIDYARMLLAYNQTHVPEAFSIGLAPEAMSNLRALLHVDLGWPDDRASLISNAIWLAAAGAIAVGGARYGLSPGTVWGWEVVTYLVLCSHVAFTDELALVLLLAAFPLRERERDWLRILLGAGVVLALFTSAGVGFLAGRRPPPLLVVKAALAVLVARIGLQDRRPARV